MHARRSLAGAMLALSLMAAPVGAAPTGVAPAAPAAEATPSPSPLGRAFTSAAYGYSLSLPSGWEQRPRTGSSDLAEVRFAHAFPALRGLYQVYEGAVTDRAESWYHSARTRYESTASTMPRLSGITFSDLETTSMGGQKAWRFGFVATFQEGAPVAALIIFTPRKTGERVDMHEVVITGDASAMARADADIEALLNGVRFSH
ncbi:MAG: hypothetical protein EB084_11025 [Proteobacteria bacterium]|nr:hypothetical protein [Pseudomonadota bacterium]